MATSVAVGTALLLLLATLCCRQTEASPATRKSLRSIDCRRLVFHPQCRGVAAKRAMPNVMEGLETAYQVDAARDPSPVPAPFPSDPLIASLLVRLAAEGRHGAVDNDARDAHDARDARDARDAQQSIDADATWTGTADQSLPRADFGRFDWQVARKRLKEQEVTYDY